MKPFYCCYVEGSEGFARQHETKELAEKEAERLARQAHNRNKRVFILQTISYCEVVEVPIAWSTI